MTTTARYSKAQRTIANAGNILGKLALTAAGLYLGRMLLAGGFEAGNAIPAEFYGPAVTAFIAVIMGTLGFYVTAYFAISQLLAPALSWAWHRLDPKDGAA